MAELLAPAGNMEALVSAVEHGADAVYIGGTSFNAREYAKNFDRPELIEAVRYCHLRGVKLYVTVNIMLLERELQKALEYAAFLESIHVDALIVSDVGFAALCKKYFTLPLHASTQLCVHNTQGALAAKKIGFSRVVLARELSLEEIRKIVDLGIEVEIFIHGALCSSVSGLCLLSSFIGQRSGNRGKCAQPCRLPYKIDGKEAYSLSTADLCAANALETILETGVTSLKIEGRMKSPAYVGNVTRIYAEALASRKQGQRIDSAHLRKQLQQQYNRTFTDAYFYGKSNVCATGRPDTRTQQQEPLPALPARRHYELDMRLVLQTGQRAKLTVFCSGLCISVTGEEALPEARKAVLEPWMREALSKTGDALFCVEHIEIVLSGNPFIARSALNELRRQALAQIRRALLPQNAPVRQVDYSPEKTDQHRLQTVCVQVHDLLLGEQALSAGADEIYYAPFNVKSVDAAVLQAFYQKTGRKPWLVLPPFLREEDFQTMSGCLENCSSDTAGVVAGNPSQIFYLHKMGFDVLADYPVNIANSETAAVYQRLGAGSVTLSVELAKKDILALQISAPVEMVVYGHLDVMWLAHPLQRDTMTDRKGYTYSVHTYHTPRMLQSIQNPVCLCVHDLNGVRDKIDRVRLLADDPEDLIMVREYRNAIDRGENPEKYPQGCTQGHLKRGV